MSEKTEPLHVRDDNFEQVVMQSSIPVLVDFWAPWCGPCRMVAPVVEELAKDYAGRVLFVKVNTDENQDWAGRLHVRNIPSLIFFKNGTEVDRVVGALPKKSLQTHLDALL